MASIILNTLRKSSSEVSFNSFQHIDGYVGDSLANDVLQMSQNDRCRQVILDSPIKNSRGGLNQATVLARAERLSSRCRSVLRIIGAICLISSLKLCKQNLNFVLDAVQRIKYRYICVTFLLIEFLTKCSAPPC